MKKGLHIFPLFIGFLVLLNCIAFSQHFFPGDYGLTGIFDGHEDIGRVLVPGSATYNSTAQEYRLSGSGSEVWGNKDAFHFMWKRMNGDFILYARARFSNKFVNKQAILGWMIRSSLEENASYISAIVHGDGHLALQFRKTTGDTTSQIRLSIAYADVIQLERKDSIYIVRVAKFGEPFVTEQITAVNLGDNVYAGLFVCSHNQDSLGKAVFRDVLITIPVEEGLALLRKDIGSNLEILDVRTGDRKLIFTDSNSIYSPIWKRDSKSLIYGRQGLLYSFDLTRGITSLLNTGDAKTNNNDHVLSFDGKMLAICISVPELGGRMVYKVPAIGGNPLRITSKGPSYPHSWSPDGRNLLISSSRNAEYDVFKIPANGGKETRLTNAQGRDDSPEYTPDSKYIYFNSNRTGTMLIWRMKSNGSNQEPVTTGEFHDWFPHISPDGKWLVFLSYSKDEVSSGGNPSYKQVYLRLMPVTGGKPKVIAYLYGGQGTINSPCWSPDSKKIAFASYSDIKLAAGDK